MTPRMTAAGIVEIRWCGGPAKDGGFVWFMCASRGLYEPMWERHVTAWGLEGMKETYMKGRTERPWMAYGIKQGDPAYTQLLRNVVMLGGGRAAPASKPKAAPPTPQAVAAAVPPPCPPCTAPAWAGAMAEFFANEDPFSLPSRVMSLILSLFAPRDAQDPGLRRFLSLKNTSGLGSTHPRPATESKTYAVVGAGIQVSTLEIHRRVMRLERTAADLAGALVGQPGGALESLPGDLARDLGVVRRWGGGLHGAGGKFWAPAEGSCAPAEGGRSCAPAEAAEGGEPSDPAPASEAGELRASVAWMGANRENAVSRCYGPIVDEITWGVPVLCRLLVAWKQGGPSGAPAVRLCEALSTMLCVRASIINQDRIYLLQYGSHLTTYCRRLQAILCHCLRGEPPAHLCVARLSPAGGFVRVPGDSSALPFAEDFRGLPCSTAADVQKGTTRRLAEVYSAASFPPLYRFLSPTISIRSF